MSGPSTEVIQVVRDTCNVYVLRSGREAVLVDFGSGIVLDRLEELGVDRVTDVLLTHHHRDQVQGLQRAVAHGARIWSPPAERELIAGVGRHWLSRTVDVDYDRGRVAAAIRAQVEHGPYEHEPIYGEGKAGERIASILAERPLSIGKRMTF